MQKLFRMFVMSSLFGAGAAPALACGGGGGGGCGMAGGGYGYGGGRAVAYGKVAGHAPMLAQARPAMPLQAAAPTTLLGNGQQPATAQVRAVATKVKASTKAPAASPVYTCPMHPQVQWTKPTDCPICGMKLKPKQTKADALKQARVGGHADMNMDEASGMERVPQDEMSGMDDMMMCPGCMMNMGGMSKMNGKQAPAAGQKASGGSMRMAGMGCGC